MELLKQYSIDYQQRITAKLVKILQDCKRYIMYSLNALDFDISDIQIIQNKNIIKYNLNIQKIEYNYIKYKMKSPMTSYTERIYNRSLVDKLDAYNKVYIKIDPELNHKLMNDQSARIETLNFSEQKKVYKISDYDDIQEILYRIENDFMNSIKSSIKHITTGIKQLHETQPKAHDFSRWDEGLLDT